MAAPTYAESRLQGRDLNILGKAIVAQEEKAAHYESKADAKRKDGGDDSILKSRAAGYRSEAERLRAEYQSIVGNIGDDAYNAAMKNAPKSYNENRLRERTYDPSGAKADEQVAMKQRRSFVQARELASKQAGIYEYRSGGSFISSRGDGSFINDRNETISVKTPIGQRTDHSFMYAPDNRRVSTALVLDGGTRDVLRDAVGGGEYATAGALFGGVISKSQAAQQSRETAVASFAPVGGDSFRSRVAGAALFTGSLFNDTKTRLSSAQPFSTPNSVKSAFLAGPIPFALSTEKTAGLYGNTFTNESRSLYTNPLNVTSFNQFVDTNVINTPGVPTRTILKSSYGIASGVVDAPNIAYQNPYGSAKKVVATVGLSFIGGMGVGQVVKTVATRSIAKASFVDAGIKSGFGALLGYQAVTNPVGLGREAPYVLAGGAAFQSGFSTVAPTSVAFNSYERLNPVKEKLPKYFNSETSIRPQEFASVGRGRAIFDVVEFGVSRRVISDVLSVTTGGRAYSKKTGRALGSYNVEQTTSFSSFNVRGKEFGVPDYKQFGYVGGKETVLVDRSGLITVSRQARNLSPTERVGLTKVSTPSREFGEVYKVFGERMRVKGRDRVLVESAFTRANVESGFGYDAFKIRRSAVINANIGRTRARATPSSLGSRSERFEFNTVLGREKVLSGNLLRKSRPLDRRAIAQLGERGFVGTESFGFGGSRSGQLTVFSEPVAVRSRSLPRYSSRAPRVQFYQDLATPRLSASVGSRSPLSTFSGAVGGRSSMMTPPSSASTRAVGLVSFVDVSSRSVSVVDSRSVQSVGTSSLTRLDLASVSSSSFFPQSPMVVEPPVEPPGFVGGGFPGVPLFGVGRGGVSNGRGRGRSFKYAPSLNALIFNIKGKKENKRLTGFETRPILAR